MTSRSSVSVSRMPQQSRMYTAGTLPLAQARRDLLVRTVSELRTGNTIHETGAPANDNLP